MTFEQFGNISLYQADNLDVMRTFEDNSYDLAIVDPNYGINAPNMQMGSHPNRKEKGQYPGVSTAVKVRGRLNSGAGKLKNRILNRSEIDWDNEIPPPEYFKELFRVSKNQIIWGGNYFPLPPTRGIIFWDKLQPWENFSQFELAWTSFDVPAAKIALSNTGGCNKEKKIHPTQKPVKLYAWLLNKYAKKGWRILDTGFGSLSSGVACHNLGFELTAIEKNKIHYNDGRERLIAHQRQLQLFTSP